MLESAHWGKTLILRPSHSCSWIPQLSGPCLSLEKKNETFLFETGYHVAHASLGCAAKEDLVGIIGTLKHTQLDMILFDC